MVHMVSLLPFEHVSRTVGRLRMYKSGRIVVSGQLLPLGTFLPEASIHRYSTIEYRVLADRMDQISWAGVQNDREYP